MNEAVFASAIFIYIFTSLKLYSSSVQLKKILDDLDFKYGRTLRNNIDKIKMSMVFLNADLHLLTNEIDLLSYKPKIEEALRIQSRAHILIDSIHKQTDELFSKIDDQNEFPCKVKSRERDFENEITEYKKIKIEKKGAYYIFIITWLISAFLHDIQDDAYLGYIAIFIIMGFIEYFGMKMLDNAQLAAGEVDEKINQVNKYSSDQKNLLKRLKADIEAIDDKLKFIESESEKIGVT